MTRRDQYSFILHVLLPAIENEGLTIKPRRDGELTLSATGSVTTNFISNLRQHCIENCSALPFLLLLTVIYK